MARNLSVYPKATLIGDQWQFVVNVWDATSRSKFVHSETAGVTADVPLTLLKLAYDLTVADTDLDSDVDDAHWVDTAAGGPTNGETLWESWRSLAETKIAGLSPGYTLADFRAAWTQQNTARVRTAARRILINGRGWTVGSVHQHEGDGTVTEEP